MRGAAWWFAREDTAWQTVHGQPVDIILCNDMLSVTDLRALLCASLRTAPIVCYFHENQLTYPLSYEDNRDYQYGMTNILSCVSADALWFNSKFHLKDFAAAAERLLRKMPDCVPTGVEQIILDKASVHSPPIAPPPRGPMDRRDGPVRFLWCHRWEYDKNPKPFFEALQQLAKDGVDFEVVLLGEQFRSAPAVFDSVRQALGSHLIHAGYIADECQYWKMVAGCDVVVSTAIQENFGMAVAQAILAGCQPILPNRLAYPELIPELWHERCLFDTDDALLERLRQACDRKGLMSASDRKTLQVHLERHCGVSSAVQAIDDSLSRLCGQRRPADS